ncbi:hypothetical protein [Mangrovibacter phragmitis]|uniref:hypothetical protein n=1 Tax=Mangrovibacter phragmitis TaxID=1691903 RepID=UPI003516AE93
MTTNNAPDTESTFRATSSFLGLLPQVAGLTVGLTALTYFTGWSEISAYYRELGAPWVTSLLTSAQIMQVSISSIVLLSTIAFLSVLALLQKNVSDKGLRRWSISLMFIAIAVYISALVLDNYKDEHVIHTFLNLSGFFYMLAAGTTVGELIACLALKKIKWGGYEVYLLYFVFFYGMSYIPSLMGESDARLDGNIVFTRLPSVNLVSDTSGLWRLVGPCGDKLLLISLGADKQGRLFKLVDTQGVVEISTSDFARQ